LWARTAITGVGATAFTRNTPASIAGLAVESCQRAIADAGLTAAEIDGIICYHSNDSAMVRDVSTALGLRNVNWWSDTLAGGTFNCALVAQAAMAIVTGMARHVVCYRALKGR